MEGINSLILLKPKEKLDLFKMIQDHYLQPFEVLSVEPFAGSKRVTIRLKSGLRKYYQIHPDGTIRMKKFKV